MKPSIEKEIAEDLLNIFVDFWDQLKPDNKSQTTRNRYASSLQALGGYLVENAIYDNNMDKAAYELLLECVGPYEGSLIFSDNETWPG